MKRITLIIVSAVLTTLAQAQGIGSIFTQQQSKTKLMVEQIAGLQTYLSAIKKGYSVMEKGLNTAHDLKNGTYSLHQGYINSLSQVSPAVRNNPKIPLITAYQQQIMSAFNDEIAWQKQQAVLGSDEISYIEKVYNNILVQCSRDLDELNIVTGPGAQIKDEERIKRIDKIYLSTNDKYGFSQSFIANAHAFALDRKNGKQQSEIIKKLYDIN